MSALSPPTALVPPTADPGVTWVGVPAGAPPREGRRGGASAGAVPFEEPSLGEGAVDDVLST